MRAKTAFWDASAVVALCAGDPRSPYVRRQLREMPSLTVWWSTPVEIASAIARLSRSSAAFNRGGALHRLEVLRAGWREVSPSGALRDRAERLLERYALRAADALQLAAALVWCNDRPPNRTFVCLDQRLSDAARREGFTVATQP
ncbi:MAG: PIN domain-containing protein [Candidatus Solibacter usitatus]|nr:PIN domain-containing protein [Candidatus Solibacter usitatus]